MTYMNNSRSLFLLFIIFLLESFLVLPDPIQEGAAHLVDTIKGRG